jgi:GSCFA family
MAATEHPYKALAERAFWRPAVAQRGPFGMTTLWEPKFDITKQDRVVTYGSCFAQHIGGALKARGYCWHDAEPSPPPLTDENRRRFNYGVFSSRTGNIYTTTSLLQWTRWALGHADVPTDVWEREGRFYDPFRPAIEPDGFASAEEVRRSRSLTVAAFAKAIEQADYFVFTLGLTESWWRADRAFEYAVCPGTVAGDFDPARDAFENLDYNQVKDGLDAAIDLMTARNPELRFILTVSPVPLAATKSGDHVLVATMASKSILRAVAGSVAKQRAAVDYFPSYEIINSAATRGMFFAPNLRDVVPQGVALVMSHFFGNGATPTEMAQPSLAQATSVADTPDELACEEALLDVFVQKS